MTPRGTDWSLALLVFVLAATGVGTAFSGAPREMWVFAAHGVAGIAIAAVLVWKLRRVRLTLLRPSRWDATTGRGVASVALVGVALGTGFVWSTAGYVTVGGYTLMVWHWAIGGFLAVVVAAHALVRAKPLRRRDVAGRRQVLVAGAVLAGSVVAWRLERPAAALVGLRGAHRRFTGSYETGSYAGNAFPVTSWVADQPRVLDEPGWTLTVDGEVDRPLRLTAAELDAGDELVATLDCTGGFHTTQRWRGVRLGRMLDAAGVRPAGSHVRVVSHTGYRWSYAIAEARDLLLATRVGDEPLDHGHGAPARLVAPGRRGFEWVKWVERIEVRDGPDPGALASTLWSSATEAGRGRS